MVRRTTTQKVPWICKKVSKMVTYADPGREPIWLEWLWLKKEKDLTKQAEYDILMGTDGIS